MESKESIVESPSKVDSQPPVDSVDPSEPSKASELDPSPAVNPIFDSPSKGEAASSPHCEEVIILDSENEDEFAESGPEAAPASPMPTTVMKGAKTKRGKRGGKKWVGKMEEGGPASSDVGSEVYTKPCSGRIVHVQRATSDGNIDGGLILVSIKNKPSQVVSFFPEACVFRDVNLGNVDLTYVVEQRTQVFCSWNKDRLADKDETRIKERLQTGCVSHFHAHQVNFEQKLNWISHQGSDCHSPDEGHAVWRWLRELPALSGKDTKAFLRGELEPLTTKDLFPEGHVILPQEEKQALMELKHKTPLSEPFVHTFGVIVDFMSPKPRSMRISQMVVELVRTKERVIVGNKNLAIWGIMGKVWMVSRLLRPGDFLFIAMGTPKVPGVLDDLPYKRAAHASFGLPLDASSTENTFSGYEFQAWLKSRNLTLKEFIAYMKPPVKCALPYPMPTSESWVTARITKTVNFNGAPTFSTYTACAFAVVTDMSDIGKEVLCLNEMLNVQGLAIGYTPLKGMFPYGKTIYLNCRPMLPHERIYFSGALIKSMVVPPLIATYWSLEPKSYDQIDFEHDIEDPKLQEALSVVGTISPEDFLQRYKAHNAEAFRFSYEKFMFSAMRKGIMSPQLKPLKPRHHALMSRLFSLDNCHDRRISGLVAAKLDRSDLELASNIIHSALNGPGQTTNLSGTKQPLKAKAPQANNGPPPFKKSRFNPIMGAAPAPPHISKQDFNNARNSGGNPRSGMPVVPSVRSISSQPQSQGMYPPSKYGNYPSLTTEAYRSLKSGASSQMNSYRHSPTTFNDQPRSAAYERASPNQYSSVRPDSYPGMSAGPYQSSSIHPESDRKLQELATREEFLLKEKKILELESEVRRMRDGVVQGSSSASRSSLGYRKPSEERDAYERQLLSSNYSSRAHSSEMPMALRSPSYGGEWSWEKPLDSQLKASSQSSSYELSHSRDRGRPSASRGDSYSSDYTRGGSTRKDYKRSPIDHPTSRNDRGSSDWMGKYWV